MSPTHAESIFGKPSELLSEYEKELIDRILEIDSESKDVSDELRELLLIGIDQYSGSVKNYINKLNIPHREKELILGLYTTTIAYSIEKAVEDLYESSLHLMKDNGRLYTFILSDTLITILNGILSFEKKIDSMAPGLTNVLLNITYTASCIALTLCEPVIGLLIQASGIVAHTRNFLQIEKLEKTIETMRSDLAAIRKHKELEKIEKVGISIKELAQSIGTKPHLIQHLFPNGLTTSVIEAIPTIKLLEKSLKSTEQQNLLRNLLRYIENNLPINKKLISDKYENIGNKIIEELKNIGINEQSTEFKQIQYITAIINSSLQSHAPVFDKITTLQKGANEMQAIVNQVILEKKSNPRYADPQSIDQALLAIEQIINNDIRGNLKDINLSLVDETKISPDIQKLLGINDTNKAELHKAEILADTYSDKTNRLQQQQQQQQQQELEQLAAKLEIPHTELPKIFQNDVQIAT
ncbi:MAG: hypothetical protein P8P83_01185 [Rickettsiaceae bacterium]|nr:hypothetical protein [Rickettsiaceae bacterium]